MVDSPAHISHDDHFGQAVVALELLHYRDDECLGLVSLEAADPERETAPVDQLPDHDLRIDAAIL